MLDLLDGQEAIQSLDELKAAVGRHLAAPPRRQAGPDPSVDRFAYLLWQYMQEPPPPPSNGGSSA